MPKAKYAGFTFVELMVTLAIMATLVTVAVPMAQVAVQRHKEHALREALEQIRAGIDAYKRAADEGRIKVLIGESGYPKTLNDLVAGVENQRSPTQQKIYFLRRLPADPMSNENSNDPAQTWALRSYASPPDEPSEGDDVFDVYSKSAKVGLNGVPYSKW